MIKRMPQFRALVTLLTFAATTTIAHADLTIEETLSVEGAGMMSAANMKGKSTSIITADRARYENDIQMQSKLIKMFARDLGPTAQIVRLDQDRIFDLNLKKQEYTESTISEVRARIQESLAKAQQAQQAQPQAAPIDESQCEWSAPKADVKRSGEKATIAGYEAERLQIIASQSCKDKKTGAVCEFGLSLDQWLAPKFAGGDDVMQFNRAYAEKMGFTAAGSRDLAERAQAMFGRYKDMWSQVAAQMKDVKGYPVKSSFALAIGGPSCQSPSGAGVAQGGMPGQAPDVSGSVAGAVGEAAGQTIATKAGESALSGVAGQLGGRLAGAFMKKKAAPAPGAAGATATAAAPATINGLTPMMTVSSELLSVSRTGAPAGAFEVPAGFKKVTDKN